MNRLVLILLVVFVAFAGLALGQVRPVGTSNDTVVADAPSRVMLESISAKYQGGLFGYSKKEKGTIKFDIINERLIFIGKDGKERFSVPYSALAVVYPSTRKVQSGTGRAVGAIPFPGAGLGGMFIKKKKNYLVINYDDKEVNASGTMNFLVDTTEVLHNSIYTIGEKAEMKPRGDAYVRRAGY